MSLLKNKNFNVLASSLFISKTGDYAYEVAFVFILLEITHNNFWLIGVVYFFRFIPFLFFGPLGGWLADNREIKANVIYSETVRLLSASMIFIFYYYDNLTVGLLILASILTTIGRSIFQPSFQTAIPRLFYKKELTRVNGIMQVVEESASVIGPLICTLIIYVSDKSYVMLFNTITYFISIILLKQLSYDNSTANDKFYFPKVYRDNIQYLKELYRSKSDLFIAIFGSAVCILFTGSILRFIIPAYTLENGGNELITSYIFSASACGTILGGICYTKIVYHPTTYKLMLFWFSYGVVMLSLPAVSLINILLVIPLALMLGFVGALVDITLVSTIQSNSAQDNIGKSFGTFSTLANTAEASSGLIAGCFAALGLFSSFIAMALLIIISSLVGLKKTVNPEK
ncbi:transporter [Pectobacterium betavasculorum]|uniref:Transporter n=1 Tax=Pectobacterium betavasculorum TaxID=55207 RepID=A0A093TFJ8_9GAMM|nr:MFS transporter [Pectobacterium betavasculorum]KFX06931.1 transporter [Pectobacterium betavasculorum]KFX21211.1 transporter [Pectobacterium betavasculorum]